MQKWHNLVPFLEGHGRHKASSSVSDRIVPSPPRWWVGLGPATGTNGAVRRCSRQARGHRCLPGMLPPPQAERARSPSRRRREMEPPSSGRARKCLP